MSGITPLLVALLVGMCRAQFPQQLSGNRVLQTSASCDDSYIYFRINFERPFRGLIYTENAFPSCIYVNGSAQAQLSYDLRVPLGGCLTRRQPNANYENSVIVQESAVYLEATDRKYLLTCVPGPSSNRDSSFTVQFGGVSVDSELRTTEIVRGEGDTAANIDYSVSVVRGIGPTGAPLSGAVDVGQDISYVVRLSNIAQNDVRIGRCWANDGVSNIQLSNDDGCSVQTTGNVWGRFQVINSGSTRVYFNHIKAWAFPTSQRVNIYCNLHVCSRQCPVTNCAAGNRNTRTLPDTNEEQKLQTINAAFSVISALKDSNVLVAQSSASREFVPSEQVEVITADVPVAAVAQHNYTNTDSAHLCINRMHFAIGLALMLLVLLLLVFAFMAVTYGSWCTKKTRLEFLLRACARSTPDSSLHEDFAYSNSQLSAKAGRP